MLKFRFDQCIIVSNVFSQWLITAALLNDVFSWFNIISA